LDRVIGKRKHPISVGACLADSFSLNMMRVAENTDFKKLTVQDHIEKTKNLTHNSHVSFFGDKKLIELPLSDFFSFRKESQKIHRESLISHIFSDHEDRKLQTNDNS
jgi:hypothetical protein